MVMPGYSKAYMSGYRRLALASWKRADDPTIYGQLEVDFTGGLKYIERLRELTGTKVTATHVAGKAVAVALRKNMHVNGKVIWGRVYTKDTVDIFYQVSFEGGKDLSGTVIPNTDVRSCVEIARDLEGKVTKLRKGEDETYKKGQGTMVKLPRFIMRALYRLTIFLHYNLGINPPFLKAPWDPFGCAMITSVGSFGIDRAYAPLYPPSRVPLVVLVGEIKERPWVDRGQVVARNTLVLNATLDHRIIDGFQAGQILRAAKEWLDSLDEKAAEAEVEELKKKGALAAPAAAAQLPAPAGEPVQNR